MSAARLRRAVARRLLRAAESRLPASLVRPRYLQHIRLGARDLEGTVFKLASTPEEREGAFRLVHDSYTRKGLLDSAPTGLKVTPYDVMPSTAIFIAMRGGAVVGTLSLIEDGPLGLPMDDVFPHETERVRRRGGRLAELSAYAIDPSVRGRATSLMLYNLMFRWVWWHRYTQDIVIAVHPRVTRFYEVVLLFDRLHARASYHRFHNAPAEALHLNLRGIWPRFEKLYARKSGGLPDAPRGDALNLSDFFGYREFAEIQLPAQPEHGEPTLPPAWRDDEIERFVRTRRHHFSGLDAETRRLLREAHPSLTGMLADPPRPERERRAAAEASERRASGTPPYLLDTLPTT
ncbi:MAG: hypothetical protein ABJD07_14325 [Gemmatimonadaceae bacterium]